MTMTVRDDLLTLARSEDTGARWIGDIAQRGAAEIDRLRADNARLRAALCPFAEVARGDRLNPTPDEWQRASAVYTNTNTREPEQIQRPSEVPK